MSKTVEVFADINCAFTHVGLSLVAEMLSSADGLVNTRRFGAR